MAAFFSSLNRTILAGVVLTLVMLGVAGTFGRMGDHGYWTFVMRWLHIGSGVMWIGLLWYFNFVQTPSMPKIPDDQKPAISKVIAPAAQRNQNRAAGAITVLTAGVCSSGIFGIEGVCTKLKYQSRPIHITPEPMCSQRMTKVQ